MRRLPLSLTIAIGLVAGLALGVLTSLAAVPWLTSFTMALEPIGTVWINMIRMCIVPLVAFAVISGVASIGDVRRLGRVGGRTFGYIFGTIILAGLLGAVLALLLAPLAPVSAEASAALRAAAAERAQHVTEQTSRIQGLGQFLFQLVPINPVKAAADGALLPLIVFSALFGAATGTLDDAPRRAVLGFSDAVVAALIRLVAWIMLLAPIGVACLAAPVAARFGLEALRSLLMFVLSVVLACIVFAVVVFGGSVRWLVRVRVWPFARITTPATTIAFTTTSSMAALPMMMETALQELKISNPVASFVLPLGATLNRPGSAIYQMTSVVFVASLYGVHLTPAAYAAALATSFLMTFSVAPIPSATVFTTAPVLLAAGLPVEAVALLLGVDRIPDMFRTALNTIGHQTAAAVVARGEGEEIAV